MDKILKRALKQACSNGWTLTKPKNGGHLHLFKPGCGLIVVSATASDHRALKNILADMKRKGAL